MYVGVINVKFFIDIAVVHCCVVCAQEMEAIRIEYRKKYNASLIDALRGDTSSTFEDILVQLAQGSRELGETVNRKKAQTDAKRLYQVRLPAFTRSFYHFSICSHLVVGSLRQTRFSSSQFCPWTFVTTIARMSQFSQSIHLCFGLPLLLLPDGVIPSICLRT